MKSLKPQLFILILLFSVPAWATTYYYRYDGTAADKESATSCSAASTAMKATVHNAETFAAGDTICFCEEGQSGNLTGGTIDHQIVIPSSGESENPIIYDGDCDQNGVSPLFSFYRPIDSEDWAGPDANGCYTTSTSAIYFLEDGEPAKKASDAVCSGWTDEVWYASGGVVYYLPTGGGAPGDRGARVWNTNQFQITDKSYLTLQNLHFKFVQRAIQGKETAGAGGPVSNITIKDCTIEYAEIAGVDVSVDDGNTLDAITVQDNIMNYVHRGIYLSSYDVETGEPITNCSITGNSISNAGYANTSSLTWDSILAGDDEGIGIQNPDTCTVSGNIVNVSSDKGIYLYAEAGGTAEDNVVSNNLIKDTVGQGLILGATSATATDITGNNCHNNIVNGCGKTGGTQSAIHITNINSPVAEQNYLINNTVYDAYNGIYLSSVSDYWTVENNIVDTASNAYINVQGNLSNVTVDYNLYTSSSGSKWIWNTAGQTWATWVGAGRDTHSPTPSNPFFRDAAGSDLKLRNNSPCIDSATEVGLAEDFTGHTIPWRSVPDIGAHEFFRRPYEKLFAHRRPAGSH